MDRDSRKVRGARPFLFTDLKTETGLSEVIAWIEGERHKLRPEVVDAHGPYVGTPHSHSHTH
jgi:hypothetical protein